MTDDPKIDGWHKALAMALACVPFETRGEVLRRLAGEHEARLSQRQQLEAGEITPFKTVCASEWAGKPLAPRGPMMAATSIMVQILVRAIRNGHSPERASAILFREHRNGTGSGWLPDYLDGLPGITVDRDRCIKIASAEAGKNTA
jgi:hypothetical protein